MDAALTGIEDVLKGDARSTDLGMDHRRIGDLAAALNEFDVKKFLCAFRNFFFT